MSRRNSSRVVQSSAMPVFAPMRGLDRSRQRRRAYQGILVAALAATVPVTVLGQLQIVDNLPGTFIDISGFGTPLNLSGDLEAIVQTTISNAVFPGGDIVVGNNGGVAFANPPSTELDPVNEPIPSNASYGGGQSALIFWDDGNTIGEVYYSQQSDRYIVQWDEKEFEGRADTATFQLQVFDGVPFPPAGGIYAQFLYADIEQPRPGGGASATIGYQNGPAAFNDVQWSFNTAGAVSNGTVLSLVVPEPCSLGLLALGLTMAFARRR